MKPRSGCAVCMPVPGRICPGRNRRKGITTVRPPPGKEKASPAAPNTGERAPEGEGDDNAVILMLLLLLGREGADQALLLALLYLLF